MRQLQILLIIAAIAYGAYYLTDGFSFLEEKPTQYIISDIYSLIVVPTETGECQAAVGYKDKHVIGTFIAEPVKFMDCREYYFRERPEARDQNATIVLVRLINSDEYHWVLKSQLMVEL